MENKQDADVSALLRDPKVSPIAAREGVVLMTKNGPLCVERKDKPEDAQK